mmetsp:Transcript_28681/g.60839  ORF Transcript_28681/g.60839 Transcript_28681/m.60839 type:complete len:327 (+) Transcript_28681:337-1317(+)
MQRTHPKVLASNASFSFVTWSIILSHLGSNKLRFLTPALFSGVFNVNNGSESGFLFVSAASSSFSWLTVNCHLWRMDALSFKDRTTLDAYMVLAANTSSRSAMTVLNRSDDTRNDAIIDAIVSTVFVITDPSYAIAPLSKSASADASRKGGELVNAMGASFCGSCANVLRRFILTFCRLPPSPDTLAKNAFTNGSGEYASQFSNRSDNLRFVSRAYSSPRNSGTSSRWQAFIAATKSAPYRMSSASRDRPSLAPFSSNPWLSFVNRSTRSGSNSNTTPSGRTRSIRDVTSRAELHRKWDVPITKMSVDSDFLSTYPMCGDWTSSSS